MDANVRHQRRENIKRLMAEAGVSPSLARAIHATAQTGRVTAAAGLATAAAGIALAFAGIAFGSTLAWTGLAVAVIAAALAAAMGAYTLHAIRKVRWQDGTITFRTVEPGDVSEHGQRVVCEVELMPPPRSARVTAVVGPLDVARLVVGATMRCRLDRAEVAVVVRAYPYATPYDPLPSGRALAFSRA
jgi:hypothetical protein